MNQGGETSAPSSAGLEQILGGTGLRFGRLQPEGTGFGIRFAGGPAGDSLVRAREIGGGNAGFVFTLPPLPRKPKKAFVLMLLASGGADYIRAALLESQPVLISKIPISLLTPPVAEGVIRGMAALGALRPGDMTSRGAWRRAIVTCLDAQAQHIRLDTFDATITLPPTLEDAGIEVSPAPDGSLVGRIGVAEAGLDIRVLSSDRVISVVAMPDVAPASDELKFHAGLLTLNAMRVAKIGLTEDGKVALLYEVPSLTAGQVRDLKEELAQLASAVSALARGKPG
jgi:hypothetical protein